MPFIARYRKEVTERARRHAVAHARGAARVSARAGRAPRRDSGEHRRTEEADAGAARRASKRRTAKQRLEDLYLPYKPKRRTKAQIAREAGLDGLAAALLADHAPESGNGGGEIPEARLHRRARRESRRARCEGCAGRRARDSDRAICRRRRAARQPARASATTRACSCRRWSKARKRRPRSSATTSPTANRSGTFRRIARSRCFAAARKSCSRLALKLPEELATDAPRCSRRSMRAS